MDGNFFRGVIEAAIVGGDYTTIEGNFIDDVLRADVSGHGMELHGTRLVVKANPISNVDGAGIFAFQLYHSIIQSNPITGVGRKGKTGSIILSTAPEAAGGGAEPPHDVQILDNDLDRDGYILLTNGTNDPSKLMKHITVRSKHPVLFHPSRAEVIDEATCDIQAPATGLLPTDHEPPKLLRLVSTQMAANVAPRLARISQLRRVA